MEPVTHMLTGACLSRSGLNRKTSYVTAAMVIGAEAPDLDMLWRLHGPVSELQHHRGITHTFLGAPFMALGTLAVLMIFDRMRTARPSVPVRWGWVWLCAFLADLSHILLDYTTNYGVRPFYPFNPHWYAWGILNLFDTFIFLSLVIALLAPGVFLLGNQERGSREKFAGQRVWAWAALTFVLLWWGLRSQQQAHASALVKNGDYFAEPVRRIGAEPSMTSPFRWHMVIDTGNAYRTASVDTLHNEVVLNRRVILKGPITSAVVAAKQSHLGKVYVDWSTWPLIEDMGSLSIPAPVAPPTPAGQHWHTVAFLDMRFDSPSLLEELEKFRHKAGTASLIGWVYVGPDHQIEGQYMHGQKQR
ncbi:MAG: metal-dependent hydrolase [Acidobacteria bacterium]|nr:metal-dependent hydrolase [Acidobacteriota bacterium]MBW4044632.1 metal-dependent hydrolase [Acidobacteriota bacterium]